MKRVLAIDAKATEHILHRQGTGRVKRIDVAFLWIQDEVRSKTVESAHNQERGECGRSRHQTTDQSSNLEALHHIGGMFTWLRRKAKMQSKT